MQTQLDVDTVLDMTSRQLVEEFRKLSSSDKASLLDAFWAELAADAEQRQLTDPERAALDRRLGDLDRDTRPDRAWSELRAEFLHRP